jgi:hypothetical protein
MDNDPLSQIQLQKHQEKYDLLYGPELHDFLGVRDSLYCDPYTYETISTMTHIHVKKTCTISFV